MSAAKLQTYEWLVRRLARVANCTISACPLKWEELNETTDPGKRHCDTCAKHVYFCATEDEVRHRTSQQQCVAIARSIWTWDGIDMPGKSAAVVLGSARPIRPQYVSAAKFMGGEGGRVKDLFDDTADPDVGVKKVQAQVRALDEQLARLLKSIPDKS